jgi:hypothetical protein
MHRVRFALAAGLTVTAVMVGIVMSASPLTVASTNGVPANLAVAFVNGGKTLCQHVGTLPRGTTAIRVSLSVNVGPRISLEALSGSKVIATGTRDAGWGTDETVTVPVTRVARTARDTRICTTIGPAVEAVQINGLQVRTGTGAPSVLLRMEYMHPGPSSWLSLVPGIARRMGLARAPGGAWVSYLVIMVMLTICALTARLILRAAM